VAEFPHGIRRIFRQYPLARKIQAFLTTFLSAVAVVGIVTGKKSAQQIEKFGFGGSFKRLFLSRSKPFRLSPFHATIEFGTKC
jgi:hypothetical protein